MKYPFTEAGIKRLDAELFSSATQHLSEQEARAYALHLVTLVRGQEEAIFGHWVQPIMERSWPFQTKEQLNVG